MTAPASTTGIEAASSWRWVSSERTRSADLASDSTSLGLNRAASSGMTSSLNMFRRSPGSRLDGSS